ncbi:MAG: hypothetical protein KKB13_17080 [Chloroflexi bacterium]|nr:hypothetical protein [Chloroflexota bacterium]
MTMHWTERSRAIAAIGEELARRGWTLHGYSPDQSDIKTDYFCPAHWDGVAVKDDAVVGVDISRAKARQSGRGDWPHFHATPDRKTWHVERGGRIVASGVGLEPCASGDPDERQAAVAAVCDRIESVAGIKQHEPGNTAAAGTVDGIAFRVEHERDWTWIYFTAKPPAELRDRLKRAGWRFGGRRQGWSLRRRATAEELAAVGLPMVDVCSPPDEALPPIGETLPAGGETLPADGESLPTNGETALPGRPYYDWSPQHIAAEEERLGQELQRLVAAAPTDAEASASDAERQALQDICDALDALAAERRTQAEELAQPTARPYQNLTRHAIETEIKRLDLLLKRLAGASDFAYELAVNDKGARLREIQAEQETVYDQWAALRRRTALSRPGSPGPTGSLASPARILTTLCT